MPEITPPEVDKTVVADVEKTPAFKDALKSHDDDPRSLAIYAFGRAAEMEREVANLKRRLPKEGAAVLSAEEAADWKSYRALGKPDVIKTGLDERDAFSAWKTGRERSDTIATAARAAGYDPEVLAKLAADVRIEVKDGLDKLGKPAKIAEVVEGDGKTEKRTALPEYAAAAWPRFMNSLRAEVKTPAVARTGSNLPQTQPRDEPAAASYAMRSPRI